MATSMKNLSDYNSDTVPSAAGMKIGIVVSDWNQKITGLLLKGVTDTLIRHHCDNKHITVMHVPGSFELTSGAKMLADTGLFNGIICIGCVIRGETPHFDYICHGVTQGITLLNLQYPIPFVFGVLTVNTLQQARDRAGGKYGNKGDEAAITAIKMISLQKKIRKKPDQAGHHS
ncbi:MAG: 6,7-dimethyl-8-ribityllumazine synthase [Bacteroidales bacterium]|nr:6,7-dimethyl-8-ribityllumazine synthase [Bacteroidales bacterium]